MKRLVLVGMLLAWCMEVPVHAAQPVSGGCLVAEFKTLALSQEDVALRHQHALAWLKKNVSRCTSEQLSAIKGNSPMWLGTALTPELAGQFEGAIEAKISGNPALMGQLYESLGKEGSASVSTTKNPTPRAPVVAAPAPLPLPPMVMGGQPPAPGMVPAPGFMGAPMAPLAPPAAMQ